MKKDSRPTASRSPSATTIGIFCGTRKEITITLAKDALTKSALTKSALGKNRNPRALVPADMMEIFHRLSPVLRHKSSNLHLEAHS